MAADDEAVRERFRLLRTSGDAAARNRLIEDHRWLAEHCARRFAGRGEPLDDLTQVAMIGLVNAVDRFDPEFGTNFPTFAIPTILGVVRRHFRDATWAIRVPRRAKELHLQLTAASEHLTKRLERSPQPAELAEYLGVDVDQVLESLEAGKAYRTGGLAPTTDRDDDSDGGEDGATLGVIDAGFDHADTSMAVRHLLDRLPAREREIVILRFFGDLTQSEIAERIGISQVHVSRLVRSSLERMQRLAGDLEHEAEASGARR